MGADQIDGGGLAIVGIGLRMPPSAGSLPAFWNFLLKGGNALRPLKSDRWDWRQYFDPDPERPGKSYAPKAAFLDWDFRQFDPLVFGISPREAASLDPQQRLLLEAAWEAFEDAGVPVESMAGTRTGVFIGAFCIDQLIHQTQASNRHLINAHSTVGASITILSNRLSHAFDLRGPSLTLDTACSSSLVALHYACQSLRLGECDAVLAGGVNSMTRPDFPILMSKGHFLSDHGECHPFDASAAGYARGEGAGIFLVKRLADARASGDRIHAVIRASGVNQDGHTDGISLPNAAAQRRLVEQVYREAGLDLGGIDYVEAHGTGTQAGDPAELSALDAVFRGHRDTKLPVGSVKSNIGHLEAAAGVAGLLKVIGILRHRQIPKTLHFENPNPKIPFDDYCLEVVGETRKLPTFAEKPVLRAGVNSFGYGGTNAHVVLESPPEAPPVDERGPVRLIPVSAASEQALRDHCGKLAFQIAQKAYRSPGVLAHCAAFRRSHLRFRAVFPSSPLDSLRTMFTDFSTGRLVDGVVTGSAGDAAGLVFVFTGMGPQWWGMGQELMRSEPIVRETIREIDAVFCALAGWSLEEAMLADESNSRMARTELAQPANFALQAALLRLWESFGIRPAAVVGHSVGEVASAWAAGVYSLEDAVRVSYHRSRLQQTMAGRGAMLAVGLPESEVADWIGDTEGVSIAAVNSFGAVTLSGDMEGLEAIAARLTAREVFNKFLRVEVAYHSPQMEPIRGELLECLNGLEPRPAERPLYSTADGSRSDGSGWDAEYWWRNVRQPVCFAKAAATMMADGFRDFLEVGPHPVLGSSVKECAAHQGIAVRTFFSLRRKDPEVGSILKGVAELYCAGYAPEWTQLVPDRADFLPAPAYSWQRERHWLESERSLLERCGSTGPVYLYRPLPAHSAAWEVEVNRNFFPFLNDHGVEDQTVFAGMGYLEAAISAGCHVSGANSLILENVSFDKVLIVDKSKLQYLVTEYDPGDGGRFSVASRIEGDEGGSQRHCRGRIVPLSDPGVEAISVSDWLEQCPEPVGVADFYDRLKSRGLFYGEAFRPTREVRVGTDCFFLRMDGSAVTDENHLLHPALFDAALQAVLFCARGGELFVPFAIERFEFFGRPPESNLVAGGRLVTQTETLIVADAWLADESGRVLARAERVVCQRIERAVPDATAGLFYGEDWVEAPVAIAPAEGAKTGILVVGASELATALAACIPDTMAARSADSLPDDVRHVILVADRCSTTGECVAATSWETVRLAQALIACGGGELTIVTTGACGPEAPVQLGASSLAAVALVAQNEADGLITRSVDVLGEEVDRLAGRVIGEIEAGSLGEVAWRAGRRFVRQLLPIDPPVPSPAPVTLDNPVVLRFSGADRALRFERTERPAPGPGQVEIRVDFVGLNYKDVLKVEGRLHPLAFEGTFNGADIGMECSGVVERVVPGSRFRVGDRVLSMVRDGFRSHVLAPEVFTKKLPDHLGFEAAGVPVAWLAAYRGLVDIADLRRGERVLIHHATGGVGLAAIQIAKSVGAEIHATAGSEEKREQALREGAHFVYSSRDPGFARLVRENTGREGIDVVIGAQSGLLLQAGLGLLRSGGRYVEIGKRDIADDAGLPMRAFNRNVLFASVDIDRLMVERPDVVGETLDRILARMETNEFRPLPVTVYPASEVSNAFADMARSRHTGKLLVDFSAGNVEVVASRNAPFVRSDGTYLITGGTSGFGLLTARWMADAGAGRIVLASRSGSAVQGLSEALSRFPSSTMVEVVAIDIADQIATKALVERLAADERPLRGVVHGAMVLDDGLIRDLTRERFESVMRPKAMGGLSIANALRSVEGLDFVVFSSSVSSLVGNPGQASYVAANAFLDALARRLRAEGIPAQSINWGALGETGVVARDEVLSRLLEAGGIQPLDNDRVFAAFGRLLRAGRVQTGVFDVDWVRWHDANPRLAEDPRFRELRIRAGQGGANGAMAEMLAELARQSREQRLEALQTQLRDVLAGTLKMNPDAVPIDRRLNDLGVDSLMVLELGLGIKERLGIQFSAMEFLKGPDLRQLAQLAESRLWKT
ncbi:MAG: SDR family NAD(P)-dependent oxidoreductase [Terrimicrobiaceae bacterium]|nr:SDR family NAD(P)-dependent oxidoreductase [Terrimicrobiaceae bacterium]